MRACMAEVFALEVDSRTAQLIGESLRQHQRSWPPDEDRQQPGQLVLELRVSPGLLVRSDQLLDWMHQRFRNEATAVSPEVTLRIRQHVELPLSILHLVSPDGS
jgi:hypothetical protein